MSFKNNPKKQNIYAKMLSSFEEKRKKEWLKSALKSKEGIKTNLSFKALDSKRLQMFSGKRGK